MLRRVPKAALLAFVGRQKYGVVSSAGAEGQPQSAVVGIAPTDDGRFVFDTLGTSRKAANLRRDPRVALVVWEGERTVQLEGVAVEPVGPELERARSAYLRVFPDGVERLAWPHITHFVVVPRWARDSDFAATPEPRIEELEL